MARWLTDPIIVVDYGANPGGGYYRSPALIAHSASVGAGFDLSLLVAAAALVLGAAAFVAMVRLFPARCGANTGA